MSKSAQKLPMPRVLDQAMIEAVAASHAEKIAGFGAHVDLGTEAEGQPGGVITRAPASGSIEPSSDADGPTDEEMAAKAGWYQDLERRPVGYHPSLPWPEHWFYDAVKACGDDVESQAKLRKEIESRVSFVQSRTKLVDDWFSKRGAKIRDYLPREEVKLKAHTRFRMIDPKTGEDKLDEQAYNAYKVTSIASLLSSSAAPSETFRANVLGWNRDMVMTIDHAVVRYGVDRVTSSKFTKAAAALMVEEAIARGWKTMNVAGPREFRDMVKQAAVQMQADIMLADMGWTGMGLRRKIMGGFNKERHFVNGRPAFNDALEQKAQSDREARLADELGLTPAKPETVDANAPDKPGAALPSPSPMDGQSRRQSRDKEDELESQRRHKQEMEDEERFPTPRPSM